MRKRFLAVGLLVTILTVLILVLGVLILATQEGRTAPPAITGLIATDASYTRHGQIDLVWSPSDAKDFAYYSVYASETEITDVTELPPVGQINDRTDVIYQTTRYRVPGLSLALFAFTEDTEYWFSVTAVDLAGNESNVETSVSATIEQPLPSIPTVFIEVTKAGGFQPATVTVPIGTTVAWTNIDEDVASCNVLIDPHTVTSDTDLFHSRLTEYGNVFTYTFTEAGVFGYSCVLHEGETGQVVVTSDGPAATATLTMAVDGDGSTTPTVGAHDYSEDETVTITATAAGGWGFDNWTGDVANSSSATTTVTMDADKTVTANFSETPAVTATLTIAVDGSGSTAPAVGAHDYSEDETVTITATAAGGWQFDNWTGDVANSSSATTTVTMDADKTVTANFSETPAATATLTMAVDGDGSTTPAVGTYEYSEGETVTITAAAAGGWGFDNWTGDVANSSSATTTVTMDADKTVTANFSEIITRPTTPPPDDGESSLNIWVIIGAVLGVLVVGGVVYYFVKK